MNKDEIGKFIKKLREEKKMTQEELANAIYCSRSNLSHIEKGRIYPSYDKVVLLSKIFEVTENEIYSGKRLAEPEKISADIYNHVLNLNLKAKKYLFLSLLIIFISLIIFLGYYFMSSYNSIKLYQINGESTNFKVKNGSLLLTKDKVIFTLSVNPTYSREVQSISLKYKTKSNNKFIVSTTSNEIYISEECGYNECFDCKELFKNAGEFYLEIDTNDSKEIMTLNLKLEYVNKNIFHKKVEPIGESETNVVETIEVPSIIAKTFEKKIGTYHKYVKDKELDINIYYYPSHGLFTVNEVKNETMKEWTYFINEPTRLRYNESENKENKIGINIEIDKMNYEESKIYDYFKINYLDKYINSN